ncbi:MAG: DUF4190 domain-containing protein [Micromonosporaceae bacterium]
MSYPAPPPPPEYPGGYASGPPAYSPYMGQYQAPRGNNGMAVASLVVSLVSLFFCMPVGAVGAILGHVSRNQIKETGEEGEGLALAGIIVGWIAFGIFCLVIAFYVVVAIFAISLDSSSSY